MPVRIDPYTGVATEIAPTAGATNYRLLGNPAPAERSPFAAGVESAYAGLRFGLPQALEKSGALGMRLTPQEEAYYQRGLRTSAAKSAALLPGGPAGISDVISGEAGVGRLIKENIFYSGPQMLATLAGSVAGAAVGGKNPTSIARNAMLGGTAAGTPLFVGSNVQRATEEGTKPLTEKTATRALIVAPAQAALETLVQRFLPVGPTATGFTGGFIKRTAKAMGAAGATEAVTEPLQQLGERFAADQPVATREAFKEYAEAAGTALLTGGALGMFGGIRNGNTPKMTEQETTEYVDAAVTEPQKLLPSPYDFANPVFEDPLYANSEGQIDSSLNAVRYPRREGVIEPEAEPAAPVPNIEYPTSTADVFSGLDDEALVGVLGTAERKIVAGEATPAEERVMRMARAEIARREVAGDAQPAGGLFGLSGEDANAARVSELVQGVRPNQFIKRLQVADEVELADKVLEQLENGDSRQGTMALAQKLGIIDEVGNERDLDAELAEALALGADGETQAADIRAKQAVLEAVQLRRNPEAAAVAAAPEVDLDQDVLPLETGLPERLLQPVAPTGTMADLLAPVREQMLAREQAAERDQQFELAEAARAQATEAQVEQDYMAAKAQTYLQQVGEPVTMKEAEVLWMRGKPANIKGWQKISPEERQQWFDVLNQDVAIPDAKIVRSDISRGVPAEAPSALDELEGLREDIDGKVDEVTARYQALNNRVNETFTPNVNTSPEGAARATVLKRLIEARAAPELIEQAIDDAEAGLFDSALGSKPTNISLLDAVATPTEGELKAKPERLPRTIKRKDAGKQPVIKRSKAMNAMLAEIDQARDSGAIANVDRLKLINLVSQNRLDEVAEYLDDTVGTDESLKRAEILKSEAADANSAIKEQSELGQAMLRGNYAKALDIVARTSKNPLNRVVARLLLKGGMGQTRLTVVDADGPQKAIDDLAKRLEAEGASQDAIDNLKNPTMMGFVDVNTTTASRTIIIKRNDPTKSGFNEQTFLHEALHSFVVSRWGSLQKYTNPALRQAMGLTGSTQVEAMIDQWSGLQQSIVKSLVDKYSGKTPPWYVKNALDPDETITYSLTNPEFQAELKTLYLQPDGSYKTKPGKLGTMWRAVVDWMMSIIRAQPNNATQRTAFDDLVDAGLSVIDLGEQDPANYRNAAKRVGDIGILALDRPATTIAGMNEAAKQFSEAGVALREKLQNANDLKSGTRKQLFGWMSINHMVQRYGSLFTRPDTGTNGVQRYAEAQQLRASITAQFAQLFSNAYYSFEQLEKVAGKAAERVGYLMTATQFEIDPSKTWAEHAHLQDSDNAASLKKLIDGDPKDAKRYPGYNRIYNLLKKDKQIGVYEEFKAVNEAQHYAMMALSVYSMVTSDPTTKNAPGFENDPMDEFRDREALRETASSARDYWAGVVQRQVVQVEKLIETTRGEGKASPKEMEKAERYLQPLEKRLQSIRGSIDAMAQSPYFHLGRFGDHFVAFDIKLGNDKRVDPDKVDFVARAMAEAGFTDAEISRDTTRSNVFMRLDSETARNNLLALLLKLQKQGYLSDKPIKAGIRSDATYASEMTPEFLTRYLEEIRADTSMDREDRDRMVAKARELWLDMLPDTALSKVMVHRNAVPGYSKDMIRNMAFRSRVGTSALANLSVAGKVSQAFTDMRTSIEEAQTYDAKDPDRRVFSGEDVTTMQNVFGEFSRRDAERSDRPEKSFIDTWRAVNHAYFLGASPAYVMVNLTQIGVLLWPEIGSKHGFMKAAQSIAKATPIALKVLKAVISSGAALGWKRAADAVITEKVLRQSGIPPETAAFIMRVVNTGNIDIGSASREQGRVSDGSIDSKTDLALRYAGAMGYYSEVFTRLIAALSARDLHGSAPDLDQYVSKVVNDTMFNYAEWNTSRQSGDNGIFGRPSKIAFSFLTYSFQLTEKLYREVGTAFIDKAKTPQEKRDARRFLGGHMAAMTVLAGSLGLPMASVFARAAEALTDLFDDDEEPYDIKAAYRGWLSDTVGEDFGKIIARGAPRALGIDIASRVGEQDILPFSKLLTDRRKWEDASKDYASDMLGSPVSMLSNMIVGARDMLDGNMVQGLENMSPIALKSLVKAYSMSEKGYTDKMGNKLPMSAGATDILTQALGFAPAEKAEYSEAKMTQTIRKAEAIRDASNIRKNLAVAIERGDREEQLEWLQRARRFDADNPAYAVIPGMGSSLKQRAKARALSRNTMNPLGVNPKDIGAQDLTRYANY